MMLLNDKKSLQIHISVVLIPLNIIKTVEISFMVVSYLIFFVLVVFNPGNGPVSSKIGQHQLMNLPHPKIY